MYDKQCIVASLELEHAIAHLPEASQWDECSSLQFDVFIAAIGFEDRATHIPCAIASAARDGLLPQAACTVLARYETNTSDNERNEKTLLDAVKAFSIKTEVIEGDSPQSISLSLGAIVGALIDKGSLVRIAFDISAASGAFILSVMHTLLKRCDSVELTVLYTEAETYHPRMEEYERSPEELLTACCAVGDPNSPHESGVELVQVNELYPGYGVENRRELIIAIPSFRTERLRNCLQYVSDQIQATPDKYVLWILGCPPAQTNQWRIDLQKRMVNRLMASMVGLEPSDARAPVLSERNLCLVSTLDYREMVRTIIRIADEHLGERISVVHMGSKMQAVGMSLALKVRSEITVCYARPSRFNPARYSSGSSTVWHVPFGLLKPKVDELSHVGELDLITTIETTRTGLGRIK